MQHSEDEKGIMAALMERLAHERLPRLIAIKEYVDRGESLTQLDIEYLEHAMQDANENKKYYAPFPEFHDIAVNVVRLYSEITAKAVENELKK